MGNVNQTNRLLRTIPKTKPGIIKDIKLQENNIFAIIKERDIVSLHPETGETIVKEGDIIGAVGDNPTAAEVLIKLNIDGWQINRDPSLLIGRKVSVNMSPEGFPIDADIPSISKEDQNSRTIPREVLHRARLLCDDRSFCKKAIKFLSDQGYSRKEINVIINEHYSDAKSAPYSYSGASNPPNSETDKSKLEVMSGVTILEKASFICRPIKIFRG